MQNYHLEKQEFLDSCDTGKRSWEHKSIFKYLDDMNYDEAVNLLHDLHDLMGLRQQEIHRHNRA